MTQTDIDPHIMLAALREAGPVHEIPFPPTETGTAWLITRYAEARRALNDPRLAKGPLQDSPLQAANPLPPETLRAISRHMLDADPPDHTRLRRLVSAAFTARRIEGLRPRIRAISDELIGALAGRDRADLIDDFAFPLPFQVICELIGVPQVDRTSFRAWSNVIVAGDAAPGEEESHAITSMVAYVRELVERRRAEPDDALMSGLIRASDAGDRLDRDELTSLVFLLLIAGHETTVNLIGNAMYLLLGRPEQAAALRADPALIPGAVDEFLRYESPVKVSTLRIATDPVTIAGTTIPAGAVVMISLMAANRDDSVFPEADELQPTRADAQQHLAFGHGVHYCLGAPLAKLEGEIAIGALLAHFPGMRAALPLSELEWRPGMLLRGLRHLPVHLR
ncbi:cytochrome P450 family protein [Allorhizocola rhizosphaerae]|uniref:cytochrome P450 family protein n=1 Tax=Allorhizocola rhizosphaerae TaxID=1872709 RepID=UPI000E3DF7DF|nr:cytochrome P450 [Allorhizocola rhizosphaerae]